MLGSSTSLQSSFRKTNGPSIHLFEGGAADRPHVVLIHGFMAHGMTFRRIVEPIAERFRVSVIDLPGHGSDPSFKDGVEPTLAACTQWLARVFEALEPNHVIAHSLGGTLTYRTLVHHELAFDSVTLVDPGMALPARRIDEWALSAMPAAVARLFASDVTMRLFEQMQWKGTPMTRDERSAYVAPLKEMDRLKFMMSLGRDLLSDASKSPKTKRTRGLQPIENALVVWGRNDKLLPVSDAPRIAEQLSAELVIFEESGHSPTEDVPDEFVEAWFKFVSESEQKKPPTSGR